MDPERGNGTAAEAGSGQGSAARRRSISQDRSRRIGRSPLGNRRVRLIDLPSFSRRREGEFAASSQAAIAGFGLDCGAPSARRPCASPPTTRPSGDPMRSRRHLALVVCALLGLRAPRGRRMSRGGSDGFESAARRPPEALCRGRDPERRRGAAHVARPGDRELRPALRRDGRRDARRTPSRTRSSR